MWEPSRGKRCRSKLVAILCRDVFVIDELDAVAEVQLVVAPHEPAAAEVRDALPLEPDRAAARAALGLDPHAPLIALMPGSRTQELERLLGPFLAAARLLAGRRPEARFVLCTVSQAHAARVRPALGGLPCKLVVGMSHQTLTAADVAIVASGRRNAVAISATLSPPSVRSVSATCASSDSAG